MSSDESSGEDSVERETERIRRRATIMRRITDHYRTHDDSGVVPVKVKNILFVGRARTGKSTIKRMLVDPSKPPENLGLRLGTGDPTIESFFIRGRNLVLNIMDTPGVFEPNCTGAVRRGDDMIMKAIAQLANLELTKFHVICFTMAVVTGILGDDIAALKLFIDCLGPACSPNACVILTHAESKSSRERQRLKRDLRENNTFGEIDSYFKQGIFFTGSIDYDKYQQGAECIFEEYQRVVEYRTELLNMFSRDTPPVQISESCISEVRRLQQAHEREKGSLESQLRKIRAERWCTTS